MRSSGVATRWRIRGIIHVPRSMRSTNRSQSGDSSRMRTVTIVERSSGSFSMFHMSASESLMCASKRSAGALTAARSLLVASPRDDARAPPLDLGRVDGPGPEVRLLLVDRVAHGDLFVRVVELLEVPHRGLVVPDDVGGELPAGRQQVVVGYDVVHEASGERL